MTLDDIKRKYVKELDEELGQKDPELSSRQYKEFKAQYLPMQLSLYERACNLSARLLSISPDANERPRLQKALDTCHVGATPEGVYSFSIVGPLALVAAVALAAFLLPVALGAALGTGWQGSLFILVVGILAAVGSIIPLQKLPYYLANSWRMRASNQMVLCVFYMVTYMRHTSNLELAIDFASEHLAPPLSLDMKKVIWDIETEKYENVKESMDVYLESWKDYNPEFIESVHLIEGSLLEGAESRRVEMLDKSLSVMLDETYEKMLHYAHNLKSPLTTLHMLGVILPILGLVILPLMVNFIPEVKWYHMAIIYDVVLPGLVFILAKSILSTRPTGYGNTDMTDVDPELKKLRMFTISLGGKDAVRLSPGMIAAAIGVVLLIAGFFPLIYHLAAPGQDVVLEDGVQQTRMGSDLYQKARFYFLDYRPEDPKDPDSPRTNGPYGMGAILMSLLAPLALGIAFGTYFSIRSKDVIKVRERTRKLEDEFSAALFQLGNRLGDGLPAEIAFAKVADVLKGTDTGRFFEIVTGNIAQGMDVERAIFDPQRGALKEYPSSVIESSMKVLVESQKKGPLVASQALINVSEYIKQMHRVDERLKDLMSDVISSMQSQISFLTPVIAGIVIGITSMISSILGTIATRLTDLSSQTGDLAAAGGAGAIFDVFGSGGIPTFHFQIIVGIYVVQITYILTIMVNGIENGTDVLAEEASLGKNMTRSVAIYATVAAVTILLFGLIAGNIASI